MPIEVHVVSAEKYAEWVGAQKSAMAVDAAVSTTFDAAAPESVSAVIKPALVEPAAGAGVTEAGAAGGKS